jgi:hypothetical protein
VSRLLRNLVLAAAGALTLTVMAVPAMAGSQTLRFTVNVDLACVDGQARPREQFVVKLRAVDGTVRRRVEGRTDRYGEFVACFFPSSRARIHRGETIQVRSGVARRQVRIPTALPAIDLATNVVSGRARLGSRLQVAAVDESQIHTAVVKVGDDGQWAYNFSPHIDLTVRTAISVGIERQGITVESWIQTP